MYKKGLSVIISAVLAIAVSGCKGGRSDAKLITSAPVMTSLYDVTLDYQGIVKAKETKNYSFMTGGKIEAIYVEKGQLVHGGDILVQLDAVEIENSAQKSANNDLISENNLNKTEATYLTNVTNAQININTLKTGIKAIDSNISAYKQSISAAEKGINDYASSIPIAEQGVAALEKAVNTDQAQIDAVKASINAFAQKLESTREAVDLAKTNLERMRTLYENGAVSKSELETIQVQYDDAEASYKQAVAQQSSNEVSLEQLKASHEANLATLEGKKQEVSAMNTQLAANKAQVKAMYAQLDTLNAQRAQSAAQLETANKELANLKNSMNADVSSQEAAAKISKLSTEQANRAVDNSTLIADADGYVMAVTLKEGEITGAGTPVVIVKSETKVVSIGVSLEDYSKLADITAVRINGDTEGKIDTISQYPDESTRTYTVDISFDNKDLPMGEIVNVSLVTEQCDGAFIPIDSVINIDGIDYVYKVNDDDTVSRIEVELGEVLDATVRAKNLTNERIVTSGIKSLNDNDKVAEADGTDGR